MSAADGLVMQLHAGVHRNHHPRLFESCGPDIGADVLDFVVDRSPHKQGLYTAGTHIPIRAPEALLASHADYALLLTWNFADEILAQQSEYRAAGGRFIVPVPEVRIV